LMLAFQAFITAPVPNDSIGALQSVSMRAGCAMRSLCGHLDCRWKIWLGQLRGRGLPIFRPRSIALECHCWIASSARRYAVNAATRSAVRYVLLDPSAAVGQWIAAVAAAFQRCWLPDQLPPPYWKPVHSLTLLDKPVAPGGGCRHRPCDHFAKQPTFSYQTQHWSQYWKHTTPRPVVAGCLALADATERVPPEHIAGHAPNLEGHALSWPHFAWVIWPGSRKTRRTRPQRAPT